MILDTDFCEFSPSLRPPNWRLNIAIFARMNKNICMYAGKLTSLALALGTRNSPSGPTGPRARTSDRLSGPSGPRGSDPRPRALRARGLGSLPRGACQLPDSNNNKRTRTLLTKMGDQTARKP